MSLLPPAMKITDPMPMTLGAAVKKALSQAVPIDSIRAFEVGDWMPDSLRPPRRRKELTPAELGHECETCGGTGRVMSMVCYGGPPIEREDDCPDCDGEGVIPSPKQEGQWMDWKGGMCPLPDGPLRHEVKFRDGSGAANDYPADWNWAHIRHPGDIVAYRVLP